MIDLAAQDTAVNQLNEPFLLLCLIRFQVNSCQPRLDGCEYKALRDS
jgi:hypothetical protein